jgi:hypothetical protein
VHFLGGLWALRGALGHRGNELSDMRRAFLARRSAKFCCWWTSSTKQEMTLLLSSQAAQMDLRASTALWMRFT